MADEEQIILFDPQHQVEIAKVAKGLQCNGALSTFKNLSETIKIATGMLPERFIPILQQLCASYSETTQVVKVGFADACALLSKFVIKSCRVLQRGMNKEDQNALITLGNQLNTDFQNELSKFIEVSRTDLINIYSQLLLERTGSKMEKLLKERDTLEIDLLRRSAELTNKASECGANQGQIDSIEYEKQIYDKNIRDSDAAKLEIKAEIIKLKGQIPYYKNKIKEHRDHHSVERGSLLIFSWKIREVYIDNGERIARENLERLFDRIRILEERLKNWSNDYLTKQMAAAAACLPKYQANKMQLEQEYKELETVYNQTEEKFQVTIQEIYEMCRSSGTTDIKSIQAVDELCHALQTGSEALRSICDKLRTHLAAIGLDSNSLVQSIIYALQLINMADEYNDTKKIKDIKRLLALE